jgi:hypothetical protein
LGCAVPDSFPARAGRALAAAATSLVGTIERPPIPRGGRHGLRQPNRRRARRADARAPLAPGGARPRGQLQGARFRFPGGQGGVQSGGGRGAGDGGVARGGGQLSLEDGDARVVEGGR